MATNAIPLILSVGCTEAKLAIQNMGYMLIQLRSWRQLLASERLRQARAVVFSPKALKHYSAEGAVRIFSRQWPLIDIIVWWPDASTSVVRQLLKAGAAEVVLDESPTQLATAIDQVVEDQKLLPRIIKEQYGDDLQPFRFEGMRSRSPKMWDIFETCERVAPTEANILILGETGTGKELLARAIHKHSRRAGKFVALNCGAVAENLLDSELFGHVKGAFTGASMNKKGLFQYADGGTLLLDEIGNISMEAQYRLLRVLQEGTIRPVGGNEEVPVDVRVIAATNTPLAALMEQGRFREDLYYRLNVIQIILPPLRERSNDIFFLFAYFSKLFSQQYDIQRPAVSDEFLDAMLAYDWPGNVRQLENFAERLLLTHHDKVLTVQDFHNLMQTFQGKDEFGSEAKQVSPTPPPPSTPAQLPPKPEKDELQGNFTVDPDQPLADNVDPVVDRVEQIYFEACFEKFQGRVSKVAEHAGITRRTLLRRMKKYHINKHDYR